MLACLILIGYMHEFCVLTCLTISWIKDPLGMLKNLLGFLGGVLLIGENYLLLFYNLLGICADSTLVGVLSTPLGEFYFATLKGAAFMSWNHGGVLL